MSDADQCAPATPIAAPHARCSQNHITPTPLRLPLRYWLYRIHLQGTCYHIESPSDFHLLCGVPVSHLRVSQTVKLLAIVNGKLCACA